MNKTSQLTAVVDRLVKALVLDAGGVKIKSKAGDTSAVVTIVPRDRGDMSRIIGKQGKTINALKALANRAARTAEATAHIYVGEPTNANYTKLTRKSYDADWPLESVRKLIGDVVGLFVDQCGVYIEQEAPNAYVTVAVPDGAVADSHELGMELNQVFRQIGWHFGVAITIDVKHEQDRTS